MCIYDTNEYVRRHLVSYVSVWGPYRRWIQYGRTTHYEKYKKIGC